jgi:hypothetical protein
LLYIEKLFEKGVVSPAIRGGKRILEGPPLELPLFKQSQTVTIVTTRRRGINGIIVANR